MLAALILLLVLPAATVPAQTFDATNLRQPTDLAATWLVHGGDDPSYAEPGFDDSSWTHFDSNGSLKSALGDGRPEVVWYRLHVKVQPTQVGLGLSEFYLSSAFEVYANGQKILASGRVKPFAANTLGGRLLSRIPDKEIATGAVVIAVRLHVSKGEWGDAHPGLYSYNLTLGQESALQEHNWLTVIGQNASSWMTDVFGLGLGIVALALFSAQRNHWEYLWIFLQFFAATCVLPLIWYEYFHNVPANWDLLRQPLSIAGGIFTILMYFAFLRLRFGRWIQIICAVAMVGQVLSQIGQLHGGVSRLWTVLALFPLLFLIAGVVPALLIVHWRKGNREAGILLIPCILQSLAIYVQVGMFFLSQIPAMVPSVDRVNAFLFQFPAGPFQLNLYQFTELSYQLSLAIIMVLRSTRVSRQQALLEGEMAAAREVQQVILPDEIETVAGFSVESAYQPAQQVGGDFFQVLPAGQGGLLLVVGDVAGKGLPAAMLVSVLVGAIRGVAEYTSEPAELLANLNDRLVGRAGASFSTALVAHISATGNVSVANAGHLSPYLDGREVELPGALPLGVKTGAHYETIHFHLAPGSRLTFYSDGVVEAQNAEGELFGFERGRAISTNPAAVIAEAAKEFGQSDDITVVAITRQAAIANAA
ncbi:MAG: PP2C family protein-serine/threonine phosphatase [Terracidiphilus sp.]